MHKITLLVFFTFISLSSCTDPYPDDEHTGTTAFEPLKSLYFPDEKRFVEEQNILTVSLDSFPNYKALYEHVFKTTCEQNKTVALVFDEQGIRYHIIVNVECPFLGVVCYSHTEFVSLKNDSINEVHSEEKFSLNDIDAFINKEINIPQHKRWGINKMNSTVIFLYVDEHKEINFTKQALIKVCKGFDKLTKQENIEFPYYINLNPTVYKLPPPPPPPPSRR
ncbi:MAG: hypothetical protein WA951_01485 [Leeuwenhoekiella sp.]